MYKAYLREYQGWILVNVSLFLFLIATTLMLVNALRANLDIDMPDEAWNVFVFLFGTQAIVLFAAISYKVLLIKLIPHNVEASS